MAKIIVYGGDSEVVHSGEISVSRVIKSNDQETDQPIIFVQDVEEHKYAQVEMSWSECMEASDRDWETTSLSPP